METFLSIGATILAVIFLIAWITTQNQKNKSEKQLLNRIGNGDTELQNMVKEKKHWEAEASKFHKLHNESANKLNNLRNDHEALKELDKSSTKIADDYKEKLRIEKGHHTRYKNRAKKANDHNIKLLGALTEAMKALIHVRSHGVIEFTGGNYKKEGYEETVQVLGQAIDNSMSVLEEMQPKKPSNQKNESSS